MPYGKRRSSFQSGSANKMRRLNRSPRTPPRSGFLNRLRSAVRAGEIVSSAARTLVNQRFRSRGPGSRTTTRHKKKRDDVVQQAEGMVHRDLGVIKMYKTKAKHGKLQGTYRYHNINNWVMEIGQGLQVVDFTEHILNRDQLIGVTSNVRNDRLKYPDDLYTLNPFYARPASALYTAEPGISRSDNLYIMNVNVRLQLLSMVQYPQIVKVYWMTPVFDTNVNPIDTWVGLNDSKRLGQGPQAVASTLATPTATAGFATVNDIDSNPFHHREFKKHWRALKANHIILQAGEQVDMKIKFDYEKIVNRETLAIRNTPYLAGLTIIPIIITYGGLIGISPDLPSKCSEVGHGAPKVGTVMNQLFTFGALPQSRISSARTYDGMIAGSTEIIKTIDDDDAVIQPSAM